MNSKRLLRIVQVVHTESITALFHGAADNVACLMLSPLIMTTSNSIDSNSSRRSLSLTVLRWSQERVHTTKLLINDMLRWPELYDVEAPHLKAALEALEKAESELNLLN